MPADADNTIDITATGGVLAPPAETVRSSADRERRLTEYIRAHTGADICVRLTPHVPTACVIPTSEEALIESDNADFSDEQARQLVGSVDADYLVLISTHPANVGNLPIADQLTADRAQQFGYALHELGHIRYTAIADAAALLEDRVDEEYWEFVHGLWNSCEDAAIENQLAIDQSQLAADRLELVNRSVSTHAEDFPSDRSAQFTFRDALEAALYDTGIYDTEVRDVLCDPDDDRVAFASDADRQAFEQVEAGIDEIVTTVLSTPDSVERAENVLGWWKTDIKPLLDPSHRDGQESEQASSNGAHDEPTATNESEPSSQSSTGNSDSDESVSDDYDHRRGEDTPNDAEDTSQSVSNEGDESDARGDKDGAGERTEGGESANPESEDTEAPDALPDPNDINTDQRQSNPGADALEYPDLGDTEDATALRAPYSGADADDHGEGASESAEPTQSKASDTTDDAQFDENGDEKSGSPDISENTTSDGNDRTAGGTERSDVADEHETSGAFSDSDTDSNSDDEAESDTTAGRTDDTGQQDDPAESGNEDADQEDRANANRGFDADASGESGEQADEAGSGESISDAGPNENPWETGGSANQTSLGSFSGTSDQIESGAGRSDDSASHEISTETSDSSQDESSTGSESGRASDGKSDENGSTNDLGGGTVLKPERTITEGESADHKNVNDGDSDDEQGGHDHPESRSESNDRRPEPSPIHSNGDEGLDRKGALDTDRDAAHDGAERETPDEDALERDLSDVAEALAALDDQDGGSGATPGSLSELVSMPDSVGLNMLDIDERWRTATVDAEFVADALRKALRESRRDAHRTGVTSGTFDRQRAGALAWGDVSAFHVPQFGEDKQYDLVIILDRSGSMRRHIETAEDALMRFALACEDIGINVCVIDLYSDEARLVKPFSVECEHVRECVFSQVTGGGTPLADALGLGRGLLEQRRNSPLVLVVTDGKPGSPDAYEEELTQSVAPVCGLTLVLDHPAGSVPDRVARNERFYDRHVYVHGPDQLTDRLDQFAVMFDGL